METHEEKSKTIEEYSPINIQKNIIREKFPEILGILLLDRTTSTSKKNKNIIWANDNYIRYGGKPYIATAEIKLELITGQVGKIIIPRALKKRELQKERTRSKAEVFTPTWVIKSQNDELERDYVNDELEAYVKRKWLEVTCGEGPYIATRYDMETGELIPLIERVGFLDRKLARINASIDNKAKWQYLVELAYKSSYGFEWNGDSLLLARENLLYTYCDYYSAKWLEEPKYDLLKEIANIISYNIFQMDGLKYIIPLSDKREKFIFEGLPLFLNDEVEPRKQSIIQPGKRVKVMNWETNKMEFFDKEVK